MDAIVSGKVEKPEGSMVFKTIESFVVPNIEGTWYVYNGNTEYYSKLVKIVTNDDNITIFPMKSVFDGSSSQSTVLALGKNSTSTLFYTQGYPPYAFIISSRTAKNSYIKSVEIGTLETT